MKKNALWTLIVLLLISAVVLAACAPKTPEAPPAPPEPEETEVVAPPEPEKTEEVMEPEPVTITVWTKEGEADGGLQYNEYLGEAYMAANPHVTLELVKKENVETLREDFQTAALAGTAPELLWTVNDHAGPFTAAELIQPVDDLFDLDVYVDSALDAVVLGGQTWGIPISNGNHLMLLYNKSIIDAPPANTDELIALAGTLPEGVEVLVFNQTEPFWMVPWLGGFGGSVFAEDGVTPTLNTPEMVATLQFLHDLKYEYGIIPAESDYEGADTLFKEGKAAMIINGDWSLGDYINSIGENLGVARIPMVSATSQWPAPYTSGTYFMIAEGVEGAVLDAVVDLIKFATNAENQAKMLEDLNRLPALFAALDTPLLTEDPTLKGSADQMVVGTPMPTVLEMRCNWDSMKPEMQAVLADTKTPEDAAAAMQAAADACIVALE